MKIESKAAIILSIGLVVSSIIFSIALGYTRSKTVAYINVKGLAEREVDANVGIWAIKFEAVDNDLAQVNTKIKKQTEVLVDFLRQQGFQTKEIIYGVPELRDKGQYDPNSLRYSVTWKWLYIHQMFFTICNCTKILSTNANGGLLDLC